MKSSQAAAAATVARRADDVVPKKLALWHTRTFRPILTHDELEAILAPLGFAPLPLPPPPPPEQQQQQQSPKVGGGRGEPLGGQAVWREYVCTTVWPATEGGGGGRRRRSPLPRPRLPYPRIDGLHLMAYKAFLVALEYYLGPTAVPNLFHVRTMPLTRNYDLEFDRFYRPMRDSGIDEEGILLYRGGTLDHITKMICSQCFSGEEEDGDMSCSSIITEQCMKKADHKRENPANLMYLVPLKELFPSRDSVGPT